jgi:hypothetical protein
MNATASPRKPPTVLKFGASIFVGWLCLWLASGVVLWLASGTYEGMCFIFLCGLYGVAGPAVFGLLGAWQYRCRAFSWERCALSAALAGLLALPTVWQYLHDWPVEHLGSDCFAGVALGVAFGLLLRWSCSLLCGSKDESSMA